MTQHDTTNLDAGTGEATPAPALSAGAILRNGREAAGLSLDAVAQQLKLAPRQVRALEEGDYAHLPGRTFVRGFVRNYARLVRIDAAGVLAALPEAEARPADSAALQPTPRGIGELPAAGHGRSGWTRWAIPLTLVAIVAAAAVYEFARPVGEAARPAAKDAPMASVPLPAQKSTTELALAMPLPNPVASTTLPAATVSAPAPAVVAAPPATASAPRAAPAAADASLVLVFRDFSWVEIKDRNGRALLSKMNAGGSRETLTGTPPFELVIGNAADVALTHNGKPVDLTPYTRQNVARFTLP